MDPVEGALIADRYLLERSIGVGGMGAVWAGRQVRTRKAVALKFVRESGTSKPEVRRRLLREARAACAVQHPNVVQIHDFIELEDGAPVIVMELLVGESLEQLLQRDGALSLEETAAIMARVVSAVGAAHEIGIVHRDLKPDNIFLAETQTGIEVKVLDFGIAKLTATEGAAAETGGLTGTGAMLGTPHYMSPEQAFGQADVDHRADIWALGIILFRCLSGQLPTKAENIGQILRIIVTRAIPSLKDVAPEAPADVIDMVDRMLRTERDERPTDLREIYELLVKHAGLAAIPFGPARRDSTPRVSAPGSTPRGAVSPIASGTSDKSRWKPWLLAAALLGAGAVSLAVFGGRDAETPVEEEPTVRDAPVTGTTMEDAPATSNPAAIVPKVEPAAGASSAPSASFAQSKPPGGPPVGVGAAQPIASAPSASPPASAQALPPAPPPELGGIVAETPF